MTWTPTNHNTWNGCVTDRDQNYDTTEYDAADGAATLFPAEQYSTCPRAVHDAELRLDRARTARSTPCRRPATPTRRSGSRWGWQSLTAGAPFNAPAHGSELPVPADHHPADRRHEHAGPLVHQRSPRSTPASRSPATTSRPPASRSTRSRSTPAMRTPTRTC